jgi:hypothetical protein
MHDTTPTFPVLRKRSLKLLLAALLALALIAGTASTLRRLPLWYTLIGTWRRTTPVLHRGLPPYFPAWHFTWNGLARFDFDFGGGWFVRYRVIDEQHIEIRGSETSTPMTLAIDIDDDQMLLTHPGGQQERYVRSE